MIPTQFLVPVRDNDGRPFSVVLWRRLHERLLDRFGGLSTAGGQQGAWLSGGRLYRDDNNRFSVDLASWEDLPDWLEIVRQVRSDFDQIAIRIEVAGISEIIQDRPDRVGGIHIARR